MSTLSSSYSSLTSLLTATSRWWADSVQYLRNLFGGQYEEPATNFSQRRTIMDARWQYFTNTVFLDTDAWQPYVYAAGLYRHTRPLYNPVFRLAAFYDGIYPGLLTSSGDRPMDGTPLAIPLAHDTPPALRAAIGQIWRWSNWQENCQLWLDYASVLGSGPVRIVDDPASGKITLAPVWPGHFVDLTLDAAGNVTSYHLQYSIKDPRRRALSAREVSYPSLSTPSDSDATVVYDEVVTKESIETRIDGRAYGFDGNDGVRANPYGFVPLVWWRFRNLGTAWGGTSFFASQAQIDELCSLASMAGDQNYKYLRAPVLLAGAEGMEDTNSSLRATPTNSLTNQQRIDNRQSWNVFFAPEGARMESLPNDLKAVLDHMHWLEDQVENNHPELTVWSTLRQMTQTTGPAVEALLGDVKKVFVTRAAAADVQTTKMLQMAVAMAGYRANAGDWNHLSASNSRASLDSRRALFLPFSLDSYLGGDLDFDIEMRGVTPRGQLEQYQIDKAQGEGLASLTAAGIPLEVVLRDHGYGDRAIDAIISALTGPLASAIEGADLKRIADKAKAQAAANPTPPSQPSAVS